MVRSARTPNLTPAHFGSWHLIPTSLSWLHEFSNSISLSALHFVTSKSSSVHFTLLQLWHNKIINRYHHVEQVIHDYWLNITANFLIAAVRVQMVRTRENKRTKLVCLINRYKLFVTTKIILKNMHALKQIFEARQNGGQSEKNDFYFIFSMPYCSLVFTVEKQVPLKYSKTSISNIYYNLRVVTEGLSFTRNLQRSFGGHPWKLNAEKKKKL